MMLTVEPDFQVVVNEKSLVADSVALLELRNTDGSPLPGWEPGAHIDVVINDELTRQYSLCGDPADSSSWKIAVLREEDGRGGSRHLHDEVVAGATLHVRGPRNHFELVPSHSYLFIAGGIGITPMLPMISAAESSGAQWTLIYVGRSRSSMAFVDDLSVAYPSKVKVFARDETDRPPLAELLASPDSQLQVYACGPTSLLDSIESAMTAWPVGALHLEHFSPKELTEPVLSTPFEVELSKSGITIQVNPDESILDAVRDAGLRVLSSCGEGTCGTCETAVLEGEVDHRDSLLTPEEQAANDTMMICVSRARSPRLTLEL
jgi:ferredoxin-NADP reductase